jgi:prolyl-tRNA editing enzyme YbaK/EbsC (Cys-tRNA(Pro) deacylase)
MSEPKKVPATERFLTAAAALGLEPHIATFPDGTRTAVDAAAAVGCDVAQIVKSLVFASDAGPVLALVAGDNRCDLAKLAAAARVSGLRQANADEVRAATGYAIGGVPPFGHPAPMPTFIDPDLFGHGTVWAAAGTPRHVFAIEPTVLADATGGESADLAEG